MQLFLLLLATYGLVFWIKYRISFLQNSRYIILDSLLECPYCLGFWIGWLVWGAYTATFNQCLLLTTTARSWFLDGTLWSFASATFCLFFDLTLNRLESTKVE